MQSLAGKRILLGITGGIAAYKSADLTRRLVEVGAEVQVVMTTAATTFITPLTMQALSGHPVRHTLLDPDAEAGMDHIELARWADLVLIAPATADFLARLTHGFADDLLSTLCLATDKPIAVAPAMNRLMWQNPATQANCNILAERNVLIWGPGSGDQACGEVGEGRMLEPHQLRAEVIQLFVGQRVLEGLNVLMTAGPTREVIDPVRFISNHSTGLMGHAIADAAIQVGARVTLVSGPVSLQTPEGVERIDVDTALGMYDAVMTHVSDTDIFIAVAAVADYRVVDPVNSKIKKTQDKLNIQLERNPDILGSVAELPIRPFCVGFAAETDNVLEYAKDKLRDKNLDMIAANQVGIPGTGFESQQNALHVFWKGGEKIFPRADKIQLARDLIVLIADRYHAQRASQNP